MTPKELHKRLQSDNIRILDVRELYEYNICRLENSLHIPLGQIIARFEELPADQELVVLCHHGIRSALVVNYLQKNGFEKVHNLEGGIHLWSIDVEPTMIKY
jgi:rhodanese-related sulfurtransferase